MKHAKRILVAALVAAALAVGATSLETQAVPPCPDLGIHCLDVYIPVLCVKPGEGWRVYSNACYAAQDCARACRSLDN